MSLIAAILLLQLSPILEASNTSVFFKTLRMNELYVQPQDWNSISRQDAWVLGMQALLKAKGGRQSLKDSLLKMLQHPRTQSHSQAYLRFVSNLREKPGIIQELKARVLSDIQIELMMESACALAALYQPSKDRLQSILISFDYLFRKLYSPSSASS